MWQGRKDCEQSTALCGFDVNVQSFEEIPHLRDWPTNWNPWREPIPIIFSIGANNVAVNGFRFRCCPIGKMYS